jgi:hypothetical protein
MVQAVSCRPWFAPGGICGGQSGTETGFSPSSSEFLCRYYSMVVPHTQYITRGVNNRYFGGRSSET